MKVTVTGGLRFKRCPDCQELHSIHEWPDNHRKPDEVVAAPMVIRDEMPAIQSQVDGSWHESKRGIRKTYQPSGNAEGKYFTEIGNEVQKRVRVKPDKKAIKDAVGKATARVNNGDISPELYAKRAINDPGKIIASARKEKRA